MSKPNLLGFRTSIGFYRNKRVRDLRAEIAKSIRRKIEFCELAPLLFQATMAYAAENQIDGDFAGYTATDWAGIFGSNNIVVTTAEAAAVAKAFKTVGLFDGDKLRSWLKFNREFAAFERTRRSKQRAAEIKHKKREQEALASLKNGALEPSEAAQIPEKTAPQTPSRSREIWLVNQQLETASDPGERKRLKARKGELLRAQTGIAPAPPSPAPPPAAKPARKLTPGEEHQQQIFMARQTLDDYPEGLTQKMVALLLQSHVKVPEAVLVRFPKLNPVPE